VLAPRPTLRLEDHSLSALRDTYSIYSQLPFISGGRLLHPPREDAPRRGDKGPHLARLAASQEGLSSTKLVKVCPYGLLIKHHAMKTYGRVRYSSIILDLGTRWRWVVRFTPRTLFPQGKSPRYINCLFIHHNTTLQKLVHINCV
jgi:hypothetical protein